MGTVSEDFDYTKYVTNPKISRGNIKSMNEVIELVPFIKGKTLCIVPQGNMYRIYMYPEMLLYSQKFTGLYISIDDAKRAIKSYMARPEVKWQQVLYDKEQKVIARNKIRSETMKKVKEKLAAKKNQEKSNNG